MTVYDLRSVNMRTFISLNALAAMSNVALGTARRRLARARIEPDGVLPQGRNKQPVYLFAEERLAEIKDRIKHPTRNP